jgi:hypothetical protein
MGRTAAPLLLCLLLPADGKPAPKVLLGKDTTVVTGPLDKDGYVDYEAALNDRLGRGISPERNANALLIKALGPMPEGARVPAEFFRRLGIEEPPAGGAYFVGFGTYLRDHVKPPPEEIDRLLDQQGRAGRQPWSAKDYPHVAGWLKANEKPLALAVEAIRRPQYFNPLVSQPSNRGPSALLGALPPSVGKCRELAAALAARAMLRVAEGKFDAAWQDLLACHRLGRLVARGAILIEALVGIAIDQIARNADLAYLEGANLTSRQALGRLKDLQALPPLTPRAGKIDLGERFGFLDSVQLARCRGLAAVEALAGGGRPRKPTPEEQQGLAMIDWAPALRNGNRWYDRMVAAMRLSGRAEREEALNRIEEDLKALKAKAVEPANLAKLVLGKEAPEREAGQVIGDILIGLLAPAVRRVQGAYDRSEQVQRNLRVAFALAAYRADCGRYPARLGELAPMYLAAVPGDLFSGGPLVYRPADKGYLLYSVGINGKDEGGRWYDDDPPGDDPGVRMPLPPLKRKK